LTLMALIFKSKKNWILYHR